MVLVNSYFCYSKRNRTKFARGMDEQDNKDRRDEIHSISIRAGKRTYFFDVKATRQDEYYLTITESKRRFSNDQGKFFYEKHKLFLYREDFEKFTRGLQEVMEYIEANQAPLPPGLHRDRDNDLSFDDLETPGEDTKS